MRRQAQWLEQSDGTAVGSTPILRTNNFLVVYLLRFAVRLREIEVWRRPGADYARADFGKLHKIPALNLCNIPY